MAQIPRVNKCAFCKEYEFIKIWCEKLFKKNVALCYELFLLANQDKKCACAKETSNMSLS